MTAASVLTIVSVGDESVRRLLARHLSHAGRASRRGLQCNRTGKAANGPVILIMREADVDGPLEEAIEDAWLARRWHTILRIAIEGRDLAAECACLRATLSEWDAEI